ncbi:thermonuclease family protein [Ensifer sp. T173]|uniref:Thermonuclease family protein n=1 Tax=Ensifer canadensis TaxID=555315 RepID=A0AAW4FPQ5_9HYPH|nr:thermonuclease family protein [Ensifer canadensis]MBM3093313.1 thermonuclease family protein [Ensifer canadensis]UBI77105.1 thermonuclease family protein [Ensifer canadensis]
MRSGRSRYRFTGGGGKGAPAGHIGTIGGWVIFLLLCAGAYVASQLPPPERTVTGELSGFATASDGDSLRLDGRRIRLEGIDAPEIGQTCRRDGAEWDCGADARKRLKAMVSGGTTLCRLHGRDKYGRDLGTCETNGRDVGRQMVATGYAVSYGRYQKEEATAERQRVGLWAGEFTRPQAWRRSNRHAEEAPHVVDGWLEVIRLWLFDHLSALFARIGDG